jgi:hypothetical protein
MITQRDLLSEGFWSNFKGNLKSLGRGAMTAGREIGKVVAPEISRPLSAANQWRWDFTKRVKAATDPMGAMKKFLIDNGYYPISKAKQAKSPTEDGAILFRVRVSELDYDSVTYQPIPTKGRWDGYSYKNPVMILQMDRHNDFKILKHPRRDSASEFKQQDIASHTIDNDNSSVKS